MTLDDVRALDNLAFIWSCQIGHKDIAEWLHIMVKYTRDEIIGMNMNINNIKPEMRKWLTKTFDL